MYKHPPDFPQHQALRLQMGALLRGSGSGKTELSRGLATAFGTPAMAALGAERHGKTGGIFPWDFWVIQAPVKCTCFSALKSGFKFSMISPRGVEGLKQWDDLDDLTLMGSKHGDFWRDFDQVLTQNPDSKSRPISGPSLVFPVLWWYHDGKDGNANYICIPYKDHDFLIEKKLWRFRICTLIHHQLTFNFLRGCSVSAHKKNRRTKEEQSNRIYNYSITVKQPSESQCFAGF